MVIKMAVFIDYSCTIAENSMKLDVKLETYHERYVGLKAECSRQQN